jgi:hypothetical protein
MKISCRLIDKEVNGKQLEIISCDDKKYIGYYTDIKLNNKLFDLVYLFPRNKQNSNHYYETYSHLVYTFDGEILESTGLTSGNNECYINIECEEKIKQTFKKQTKNKVFIKKTFTFPYIKNGRNLNATYKHEYTELTKIGILYNKINDQLSNVGVLRHEFHVYDDYSYNMLEKLVLNNDLKKIFAIEKREDKLKNILGV